jgi:hypothetical protein
MTPGSQDHIQVKTTREVALMLGLSEPSLNARIRRRPELSPPVVSGRRLWSLGHISALRRFLASRTA